MPNPSEANKATDRVARTRAAFAVVLSLLTALGTVAKVYYDHASKEQKDAELQRDEAIKIDISVFEPGAITIKNSSKVDVTAVEIERQRLYYSAACEGVYHSFSERPWQRIARLPTFGEQAFKLENAGIKDALTGVGGDGRCANRPDMAAPFFTWKALPIGSFGTATQIRSMSIQFMPNPWPNSQPPFASVAVATCSPQAPCRIIEYFRARAQHAKTYVQTKWFEELYVVDADWRWTRSDDFRTMTQQQVDGELVRTADWKDPHDKIMFARVAQRIRDSERSQFVDGDGPFHGEGLWRATEVAPP